MVYYRMLNFSNIEFQKAKGKPIKALNITQKPGLSVFWEPPTDVTDISMITVGGVTLPIHSYSLVCFFSGFILFVFVTWHIFRDRSTMYALERHLMFNPPYEIAFQGTNLILNRRKKDERPIRIVLLTI